MLALIPWACMMMKAMRIATGRVKMATKALGRWKRKRMVTRATTMLSSMQLLLQGRHRPLDQAGAVIDRFDLDPFGQTGLEFAPAWP